MPFSKHLHLTLADRKFFFRPIIPSDKAFVKMGYRELSDKSRYLRFFAHQNELSVEQLKFFTEVDGQNHVAWGIMDVTRFDAIPAGTGRFIRLKEEPSTAEVAITIVDAFQRMGLGRAMMALLNLEGSRLGIERFRYHVLPENIHILRSLGPLEEPIKTPDHSVWIIEAGVVPGHAALADIPENRKFRDMMQKIEEKIIWA